MVKGSGLMVDSSIITYAELLMQEIDVKIYAKKLSIGLQVPASISSLNFLQDFYPKDINRYQSMAKVNCFEKMSVEQ